MRQRYPRTTPLLQGTPVIFNPPLKQRCPQSSNLTSMKKKKSKIVFYAHSDGQEYSGSDKQIDNIALWWRPWWGSLIDEKGGSWLCLCMQSMAVGAVVHGRWLIQRHPDNGRTTSFCRGWWLLRWLGGSTDIVATMENNGLVGLAAAVGATMTVVEATAHYQRPQ